MCGYCFLDATFLEVTTTDNASFQFLKFAVAVLLALRTSLTGIMSSSLCEVSPRIKVQWSMRFLIYIQMACSQAVQTLSSSFRTALRDCGSGRYFSTESTGFECGLVEVMATVIMAELIGFIVGRPS